MDLFIKNQDELKLYVPANVDNDFESVRSSIGNAQIRFILPVIGQQLYDELIELHNSETAPTDLQADLISEIQRALAHFTYHLYSPYGQVQITDRGFQIESTETHKQAFQWMVDMVDEAFLQDAYIWQESLMRFLYVNQEEEGLAGWVDTEAYNLLFGSFINLTSDFKRNLSGRAVLNILRNTISEIEQTVIPNNITQELTDELITQIKANTLSVDNKKLLPFLQRLITHESIARAYDEFLVEETTNGLILRSLAGTNGDNRKTTPADMERISITQRKAKEKAGAALRDLTDYLNANASAEKYSAYFSSALYRDPTDETIEDIKPFNSIERKSFRV